MGQAAKHPCPFEALLGHSCPPHGWDLGIVALHTCTCPQAPL